MRLKLKHLAVLMTGVLVLATVLIIDERESFKKPVEAETTQVVIVGSYFSESKLSHTVWDKKCYDGSKLSVGGTFAISNSGDIGMVAEFVSAPLPSRLEIISFTKMISFEAEVYLEGSQSSGRFIINDIGNVNGNQWYSEEISRENSKRSNPYENQPHSR